MTSAQIERNNELANVALDGEKRMEQVKQMIRAGNDISAKTHLEQAHRVIHRLENEVGGKEI